MLANFSNLITFSRGSNATVTDASGRLTYAANNLVTNSQDFEATAWTKLNLAVTANTTAAPDGSVSADTFTAAAGTFGHSIRQLVTVSASTPYVFSVYAKAGTNNFIQLANTGDAQAFANFDLANGAVGSAGTKTAASITPAGNGWYRCSAAFNSTAVLTNDHRFYITSSASAVYGESWTTAGTETVLIWGAQLEAVTYQTTPSPYVSTSVANLIGFSEDFTNAAWTKQRASIVPNAAQNPINGLWTAQKLMEDTTASNSHRVSSALITMPSGILSTVSVYMKAAERTWGYITDAGVTNSGAYVNLATGEFGTIAGGVTRSSIQSVGNGWYRVSISGYLAGTLSQLFVSVATSNGNFSYTGDGNSGIYIYGAQLSNSGSLDPYVPTPGAAPSSTAYYGPRFDYDPVTLAAKGILIEEQRTNLLTYSEQFDNGAWSKARISVTPNAQVAPDGTLTADVVTANVGTSDSISQGPTLTAAIHTVSIYLRGTSSSTQATIGLFSGGFLPATGQILSGPGSISGSGLISVTGLSTTQWTRISFTTTSATPAGSVPLLIYPGGGGTANASIAMWGAQLEAGAFATSYIPTVASQVTRTADVAQITGSLFSQWFNSSEGTLAVKFDVASVGSGSSGMGIAALGTASTNGYLLYKGLSSPGLFAYTDGNSASLGNLSANVEAKAAVTYNGVSNAGVFNGATPVSITTTAVAAPNRLSIGFSAGAQSTGHIQNITYYPTRLTNDQLQAATT